MTNTTGKGGKRKSPLEGFNNVPKILEEARRMVDEVTQSEAPDKRAGATESGQPTAAIVPSASLEPAVKPKRTPAKKTSAPAAADVKAAAAKKPRTRPAAKKSLEAPMPPPVAVPPEKFGISIIHRVPGRTRVKLRQMKADPAFAKKVEERLAFVPGVIAVETSTITARAVLYYNPGLVCQPVAFRAWQEAWQDLFPGMQTDKLVAAMTCQKLP